MHFDRRAYTPSSYGAHSDSRHRCNQRSAGSHSGASGSSLVRRKLHGCTVCDSLERALRLWRLFVQQSMDHLQRHQSKLGLHEGLSAASPTTAREIVPQPLLPVALLTVRTQVLSAGSAGCCSDRCQGSKWVKHQTPLRFAIGSQGCH